MQIERHMQIENVMKDKAYDDNKIWRLNYQFSGATPTDQLHTPLKVHTQL